MNSQLSSNPSDRSESSDKSLSKTSVSVRKIVPLFEQIQRGKSTEVNFRLSWIVAAFLLFSGINFIYRFPSILSFGYLNEDLALIRGAANRDLLSLFWTSYGPNIIRPFQVIGMGLEYQLFGLSAFPSHLVSLAIVSISQAIIFCLLFQLVGTLGAFAAVIPLSISLLGADSNYWLSDRHDLYLLFFAALSLVAVDFLLRAKRNVQLVLYGLALFVSLWGGFYSNEKGTTLPVVIGVYAVVISLSRSGRLDVRKAEVLAALCCILSIVSYFAFRYSVLGMLIGGYDNKILPDHGFSLWEVALYIANMFSLPFKQNGLESYMLFLALGLPAWLFVIARCISSSSKLYTKAAFAIVIICFLSFPLITGLPTYRFMLNPEANGHHLSRMYWWPHICSSLAVGSVLI